ncbi:16S rRNA (cytidine1402-2'-O)-methyltransferase [Cyclonatronum proteinivorum]|uniref:16S rRNA (Cytidine1402-2'-O)-methyltransferase n=1 Tax=Cyclonatronum proteinivorum TaxID=1457365 RepID=A0A345UJJ6_9BACT|nr:SAM-dependent methyltransferase [Cyclonatronum proteinivorum]AXJ00648.1 16S rRNA (cytidine1402-2'-O)-methyltransferase [Cyclonatronum proteinivorum]
MSAESIEAGFGKLFLIPTPLSRTGENTTLPAATLEIARSLDHFAVENIRQAASFLQWIQHPVPEFEVHFFPLSKSTSELRLQEYVNLMLNGTDLGVLTDAGCPGVADPGADLVKQAHKFGIKVVPLTGPASPILALMGLGLGGQKFAFSGYLPSKAEARATMLRELEQHSAQSGSTELFMETPFRNLETLKAATSTLRMDTQLGVAANLTSPDELIIMCEVSEWQRRKFPDIQKIPAIFGLKAAQDVQLAQKLKRKAVKKKFSA